ncbi:MAG: DUF255 domain-containing protein [Sphingobacteriales bacterium]|jgi:thioredoxin-related protein|nr:DUF255 domain-containing protein [Sphingobacteriales bacterium]MBP9142399.1 DUF255 domain-containing protein [Chitinophagales bacterium]MDA0199262.1 DUF255 domain-containing protein [Bacteroidota bacterium]MBK6889697.1 DUF255 domain-containing protein [Sphingobacteriales bacterium]MBK7527789.1 DUF255 domain-containing protein [Sphingobacteriales bacterium]
MQKVLPLIFLLLLIFGLAAVGGNPNGNNNGNTSATKDRSVGQVKWLTLDEAIELHKDEPKKIFVDLYTDWCVWCAKMDKATFQNPIVAEYINDNFYPVKLNAETAETLYFRGNEYAFLPEEGRNGLNEITLFLTRGQLSFPAVVFLDETLENPQPVSGFLNPANMDALLKFFGEDYYKNVDWGLFNQLYESPFSQGEN